jgi:hypothetical protein
MEAGNQSGAPYLTQLDCQDKLGLAEPTLHMVRVPQKRGRPKTHPKALGQSL